MERLFQLQEQLLKLTPMGIVRDCAKTINWEAQLLAIRGAKGVGKSTMMLQYIRSHYKIGDHQVLYCSLDTNYFADHSILDLADSFYKMGGKHLFLDEVHKYANWSREIKEIYDFYPNMRVVIYNRQNEKYIFQKRKVHFFFAFLRAKQNKIVRLNFSSAQFL